MKKNLGRVGVWLIGAYGDIATTLTVGKCALQAGLVSETSLVSCMEPIKQLDLLDIDDLVIGGHDVIAGSLCKQAEVVCEKSKTYSHGLLEQIKPQLAEIDLDMSAIPELGFNALNPSNTPTALNEMCKEFQHLLAQFKTKHQLGHLVVVNLASAEPNVCETEIHADLNVFEQALRNDCKDSIVPSMLYAYCAFLEGCSYVNFTSNTGAAIPALSQLALACGQAYCGNDGKTGETLLKTALAPMFAARNLKIMSWEGINLLGNEDGKTLSDPENRAKKLQHKGALLSQILGYPVHSGVTINYVPSLGDWKTAWDLIHFRGFLDVPMTMQFTWQGCDSILAAPLVLDLVRFTEYAHRKGESGALTHLACFFKKPLGTDEHHFFKQFERLLEYTERHLTAATEH